MAGMTSHKVTVGIYNPDPTKKNGRSESRKFDRYFTNISWSPDKKSVLCHWTEPWPEPCPAMLLWRGTGEPLINPLYEEEHTKWAPTSHRLSAGTTRSSSIRASARQLQPSYLMDTKTSRISGIPHGAAGGSYRESAKDQTAYPRQLGSTKHPRFNEKTKEVIIASTEVSPLQSNNALWM